MTERIQFRKQQKATHDGTSFVPHDAKACAVGLRDAAKVLADLQSLPRDARSLFRERNDEAIRNLAELIPAGSVGASYQKALSQMWKEADREHWEAELAKSVNINE